MKEAVGTLIARCVQYHHELPPDALPGLSTLAGKVLSQRLAALQASSKPSWGEADARLMQVLLNTTLPLDIDSADLLVSTANNIKVWCATLPL